MISSLPIYTFSGSHPNQVGTEDNVEYIITHNLGRRPMIYEVFMHRDDIVGGKLSYVNDSKSLNNASDYGAFTVNSLTVTTLSLVIYKAGVFDNTTEFTFNIYG